MSKNRKFAIRVSEKRKGWTAEITRQVTSRRTMVSKRESGFESEAQAQDWAEKTLAEFVENQAKRNDRKAEKRSEREAAALAAAEKKKAFEEARKIADEEDDE
ncbi:DUF3622 domain-containing protein [Vibrio nigripulchritudo]|uniref:DUF3622 domain-containing protein n=1 Tax=Vibrio nigripulchritudo TaxID=28173 RepID=UPI0003B1B497|nr:DUF3622 domain-containing protein [Vibrio nigripulchritudo]BDU38163.1 hypothetical protein TUMSATVNIG2_26320 [Vibrio nigripulchritudo]BDU43886.1 hypothetical protein TUMSATVNIG3_26840 [Vibrio nigripulchritudo]CCN72044.1 conserved hypothetical protein [Vibrio nigripulchritudo SFn118]